MRVLSSQSWGASKNSESLGKERFPGPGFWELHGEAISQKRRWEEGVLVDSGFSFVD
jgi:hypothetical protein